MITEGSLCLTYDICIEKIILKSTTLGGMFLEAKDIVKKKKYDKSLLEARFVYATFLVTCTPICKKLIHLWILFCMTVQKREDNWKTRYSRDRLKGKRSETAQGAHHVRDVTRNY